MKEMRTFKKTLYARPFRAILSGKKTIEIRANKYEFSDNSFNLAKPGDQVIFTLEHSNQTISCTIKRISLYQSVRDLLIKEGIEHTLSSSQNIEEGIKSIEAIPGYKELIEKNGVFAIEIEKVPQA